MNNGEEMLRVEDLHVSFKTYAGVNQAVRGVDFTLNKGETLAIVGESGCGKTVTSKSIMRILPDQAILGEKSRIWLEGQDLLQLSEKEMAEVRGRDISMIFQDPMTSLNPVMTVQDQIAEMVLLHQNVSEKEAIERAREMLALVGIRPERGPDYPHQFSGGMKQRVVIAIALACNPALLIADEPTTALDVTIQAQVLELMRDLKQQFDSAMILISHDIGVVAEICDSVAIMYAGRIVEKADAAALYDRPLHPYTQGLFSSIPDLTKEMKRLHTIPGLPPDQTNLPDGCCFAPRCCLADDACRAHSPEMREFAPGHFVACFKAGSKIIQDDAGTEAVQP